MDEVSDGFQERERQKEELVRQIPPEPDSSDSDAVRIVLKTPNGKRLERRFCKNQSSKVICSCLIGRCIFSLIDRVIHSVHTLILSFMCTRIDLLINAFFRSFIHSFVHYFVHSFIHFFITLIFKKKI